MPWYALLTSPREAPLRPLSFIPSFWPLCKYLPTNTVSLRSVRSFQSESQSVSRETPQIAPLSALSTGLFHLSGVSQTLRTHLLTARCRVTSALPGRRQTSASQANPVGSPLSKDRRRSR